MATSTERKTVAWYWDRLGAARPAGLQSVQTVLSHGTTFPHRRQRSPESLIELRSLAPLAGNRPSG
jgi:hypothetical protein